MADARLAALQDQAAAATGDAGRLLATAATELAEQGEPVVPLPVSPFHRRLHTRMAAALRAGRAARGRPICRHLHLDKPGVGFWLAASPDMIRCARCAQVQMRYYQDVESCCECGSTAGLFWGAHRLPATVLEREHGRAPVSLGGLVVRWTACQRCLTSAEPPEAADGR
jgi:hypothetical protein